MDETATLAMRGKILRRFDELFAEGYAAGYRDARAGRPHKDDAELHFRSAAAPAF